MLRMPSNRAVAPVASATGEPKKSIATEAAKSVEPRSRVLRDVNELLAETAGSRACRRALACCVVDWPEPIAGKVTPYCVEKLLSTD